MAKNKSISFKIEDFVKEEFEKRCKDNFTTPSHVLYKLVHQYNRRHRGAKIELKDFTTSHKISGNNDEG